MKLDTNFINDAIKKIATQEDKQGLAKKIGFDSLACEYYGNDNSGNFLVLHHEHFTLTIAYQGGEYKVKTSLISSPMDIVNFITFIDFSDDFIKNFEAKIKNLI